MTAKDSAGVDYAHLDAFKVQASRRALQTTGFITGSGWEELTWTRGESAYAVQHAATGMIIAMVIEGLGTKNLVAENPALRAAFGQTFYRSIAHCNIAMIMNDLITIGAMPLVAMQHPALAEGNHLSGRNGEDLIQGTFDALEECDALWGPGETPELSGIIMPGTMCLSGAAMGTVRDPTFLINPENLRAGDLIVLLGSSGIHANGLSKARAIAEQLPQGYLTPMPDGNCFGEALLTPTQLYVQFMKSCQDVGIPISYAINMTGHGWRKLMRAPQPFTYRMCRIPKPHEVFTFMQHRGKISDVDAYKAFNMGAGFALMVRPQYVEALHVIGSGLGIRVMNAGMVEEGPRCVIIEPLGDLKLDSLSIR